MKILVTGGTGFLGTHLVPKLLSQGHQIRLLARQPPKSPALAPAEYVAGDMSDRDSLRRAVTDMEAVFHLAGLVSFDPKDGRKMYALHVEGTRVLLDELKDVKLKRFVLASTSGTTAVSKQERVLDETNDAPIDIVGRWPYYLSKIYEEKLTLETCRKRGTPLVVMNPSLLLGPGDERLSSTWTVSKFLAGDIQAMPTGGLSFVDVRDAADAFVQALERGELCGKHLMGVNMSFREFFDRLERLTGVPAPRLKLPSRLNILGGLALEKWAKLRNTQPRLDAASIEIAEHFFYLDASKAERELGFKARDPHETLFDTVQDLLGRMPPGYVPGTKGRLAESRKGTPHVTAPSAPDRAVHAHPSSDAGASARETTPALPAATDVLAMAPTGPATSEPTKPPARSSRSRGTKSR